MNAPKLADYKELKLQLGGIVPPGQQLVVQDDLVEAQPRRLLEPFPSDKPAQRFACSSLEYPLQLPL